MNKVEFVTFIIVLAVSSVGYFLVCLFCEKEVSDSVRPFFILGAVIAMNIPVFTRISGNKSTLKKSMESCDPDILYNYYKKLFDKSNGDQRTQNLFMLMSAAEMRGDFDDVLLMLQSLNPSGLSGVNKFLYYSHTAIYNCHAGYFDEARQSMEIAASVKRADMMSVPAKMAEKVMNDGNFSIIALSGGFAPEAELFFRKGTTAEKYLFGRCEYSYYLAMLLVNAGRKDEAEQYFRFAADNAPKCFIGKQAAVWLTEQTSKGIM